MFERKIFRRIMKQPIFGFRHNKKPIRKFSFINDQLSKLRYPLYFYILAANGFVYLAWHSGIISKTFLMNNFFLNSFNMSNGKFYTLYTYAFAHTSLFHLLMNGVGIYFVGRAVEVFFGSRVLLNLHVLGAISGGIYAMMKKSPYDQRSIIGSSASFSAILAFFIMNFPKEMFLIFPIPIPIPAWLLGFGYFFYSWAQSGNPYSQVSHAGHFGGFLAGLTYYFYLRKGFRI